MGQRTRTEIVDSNDDIINILGANIKAIKLVIAKAPKTLRPALRMGTAHNLLELDDSDNAKNLLSALYGAYSIKEVDKNGQ